MKTIQIKAWPWCDVTLRNASADWICVIILSTVVCGTYVAEPDIIGGPKRVNLELWVLELKVRGGFV